MIEVDMDLDTEIERRLKDLVEDSELSNPDPPKSRFSSSIDLDLDSDPLTELLKVSNQNLSTFEQHSKDLEDLSTHVYDNSFKPSKVQEEMDEESEDWKLIQVCAACDLL